MRTLLTTPRLQLSPFSLADSEELHELFSDPLTHTIGSGTVHLDLPDAAVDPQPRYGPAGARVVHVCTA
jgi:hypothetical protein